MDTLGWGPTEINGIQLLQRSGRFDVGSPEDPVQDRQFTKVVGFWVPRRWLTSQTMDVDGLVAEIEKTVRTRGFITSDGQVITSLRRIGPWDASFEAVSIDVPLDIPARRDWGAEQRTFFGVEQPYQMADDDGPFTSSSVSVVIADPYLSPGEMIAGLIHGARDRCHFTCPCHYATVVYTTRHRLVCMSCGATHVILQQPVMSAFRQTVAAEEWNDLFSAVGNRRHEPLDLAIIDIQDIESASFIWATEQWDAALHGFKLAARSTPEEYERAIRGTERDASILLEAGWVHVPEPPAPAFQIMDNSLDVDLMDGAGHALADGVADYLTAYLHPERLLNAVKDLFQAIELLLKARLEAVNPLGLRDQPNIPTVLTRLVAAGITLSLDEVDTVTQLRRLRNDIQHSSPRTNYRAVLALCRRSITFIDRFVVDELSTWAGDVIAPNNWYQLLAIEEIRARAVSVAEIRLGHFRDDPEASITTCPRCSREAMLRPAPDTGACCVFCRHIPVLKD